MGRSLRVFSNNTSALSYFHCLGPLLTCPVSHGHTSPSLKGVFCHHWCPVPHEDKEFGCSFAEPSRPVPRLRVDLSSGGHRGVGEEVINVGRPLYHLPQLSSPRVFLPPVRSHGSGDGSLSPFLGRAAPRLYIPSLHSVSLRAQNAPFQQEYSSLWWLCWFPEFQSLAVAPLVALPLGAGLLRQPQVCRLRQNLLVLQLHAWCLCSVLRNAWSLSGHGLSVVVVSPQLHSQALPASVGGLSPLVLCSQPFVLQSFRH